MKTLFDELQCEVKNWWLSLAWHTLRSSCRQPDVRTVERLRSFKYPVQHIHVIQRFAGDFFCCKQPEKMYPVGAGIWPEVLST